jgi:hypothetical protein
VVFLGVECCRERVRALLCLRTSLHSASCTPKNHRLLLAEVANYQPNITVSRHELWLGKFGVRS